MSKKNRKSWGLVFKPDNDPARNPDFRKPGVHSSVAAHELIPILCDAFAWGLWMQKMGVEAEAAGDSDAAKECIASSTAIIFRVQVMADKIGFTLPDIPDDPDLTRNPNE